jgi:hypothetical protein
VPPQDGVRRNDHVQPAQPAQPDPREPMQQRGEERAVGAGQPWLVDLALQDGELMPQGQDFDVLVPVAPRQQA